MKDERGPVFVICRDVKAGKKLKRRLPKGSQVVIDPCALDNYMSADEFRAIESVAAAKEQMGVN